MRCDTMAERPREGLIMTQIPMGTQGKGKLDAWLATLPPQQTLRWALDTFGPRLVMTSSFGLSGVALIDMMQAICRDVPVVFVDTGFLFEETLRTRRRLEAAYRIQVLEFRSPLSVEMQANLYGPDLPRRWPDLCCTLRKVEPMHRAMEELQPAAVINGRARFQARTRRDLPVVEWDQTPVRINPLASWSQQQIEQYVAAHRVPYNPLHDRGYPSVGCRPCTQPVASTEDVRAGRWAGLGKIECGLWTAAVTAT